ncbi:hypothetical protein [Streptomyces sp. NPDC093970]|uniref:oxidoreductase n=1 Tax=Streptomyces sp. NPDC093970 TaxID=3155076 RepID=UPI003414D557
MTASLDDDYDLVTVPVQRHQIDGLVPTLAANGSARIMLIAAGNYTPDKSTRILRAGRADAIAFGRLFIANPDLPSRLADGSPFDELRPEVISGGDATGYTDYPSLTGQGRSGGSPDE